MIKLNVFCPLWQTYIYIIEIAEREQELKGNDTDLKSHHSPECYVTTGHGHGIMIWPCVLVSIPTVNQ